MFSGFSYDFNLSEVEYFCNLDHKQVAQDKGLFKVLFH